MVKIQTEVDDYKGARGGGGGGLGRGAVEIGCPEL